MTAGVDTFDFTGTTLDVALSLMLSTSQVVVTDNLSLVVAAEVAGDSVIENVIAGDDTLDGGDGTDSAVNAETVVNVP